jgi:hypothetical protein
MTRWLWLAILPVILISPSIQAQESAAVLVRSESGLVVTNVLARPGDRVQIAAGDLIVNGRRTDVRIDTAGNWGPQIVAPRTYFIAGDPATLGNDPRAWGLVSETRIIGTVQVGAVPR